MADRESFDLVSEPWISVLNTDGHALDVSLERLFADARVLRGINGDAATQDFALLRLALAILTRALNDYGPQEVQDAPGKVAQLLTNWETDVVPVVLDYLGQHRHRFDLFHASEPFYQVAGMHTAKGEVAEPSKIIVDMPAGRPYLTLRSVRAAARLVPAEAARWLVHVHAYDASGIKTGIVGHPRVVKGKVYPEGVAWTGQLGAVHLVGESLMHTLLLNLWAVLPAWEERDIDLPPWERPHLGLEQAPDLSARPAGPVDLYTWQPRRVLLIGNRGGVTGVLVTYGDTFTIQERQRVVQLEPMSLWRYSDPQSKKFKAPIQMPSTHRPGVSLWRGMAAVMPTRQRQRDEKEAAATQIVEHASRLARSELVANGVVRYRAIGVQYGSNNSVIDEIIEDSLDLPAVVLDPDSSVLRQTALDCVNAAKSGVLAFARLARSLANAAGAGTAESQGPGDRAFETAFAALDMPYRNWLRVSLAPAADEPFRAEAEWHVIARQILDGLGQVLVSQVPNKAWVGFGASGARDDVGAAYQRFRRDLGRAFPRARMAHRIADDVATEPEGVASAPRQQQEDDQ